MAAGLPSKNSTLIGDMLTAIRLRYCTNLPGTISSLFTTLTPLLDEERYTYPGVLKPSQARRCKHWRLTIDPLIDCCSSTLTNRTANAFQELVDVGGDSQRSTVRRGDANVELPVFCSWLGGRQRAMDRAFVFVDPYAMQVDWKTIKAIADTKRADLLMLFPLMSLRRNLKREGWPTPEHQSALNRFYDGDSWRSLYSKSGGTVFRPGGDREIVEAYVEDMKGVFAEVADPQRTLGSATDGSLFTMIFGASNPDAADLAARIARGVFSAASGIQRRMRLE